MTGVHTTRPLRIALTGGIASGKSAVAEKFAELGVPIIDTDVLARGAVESGTSGLAQVVAHFGQDVLAADGSLDRRRLRERIFRDAAARKFLEGVLHPLIRDEQERLAQQLGGAYQIHVVPLLVENGLQSNYDRVLVVDCPAETQLQRLMDRDGSTLEDARRILAAQATREQRLKAADDVIENTGSLATLGERVQQLHRDYTALTGRQPPR